MPGLPQPPITLVICIVLCMTSCAALMHYLFYPNLFLVWTCFAIALGWNVDVIYFQYRGMMSQSKTEDELSDFLRTNSDETLDFLHGFTH
jgi:hypothetical protein